MDREIGDSEALLLKSLAGVQHRVVLEGGGDYMGLAVLFALGPGRALYGPVVALAAAGGEVYLVWLCAETGGHVGPRLLEGSLGLLAQLVETGGIAVHLPIEGEHCRQDLLRYGSGGGVVGVNFSFYLHIFYILSMLNY